jgi:hypothetical protein
LVFFVLFVVSHLFWAKALHPMNNSSRSSHELGHH